MNKTSEPQRVVQKMDMLSEICSRPQETPLLSDISSNIDESCMLCSLCR